MKPRQNGLFTAYKQQLMDVPQDLTWTFDVDCVGNAQARVSI
ncbi:hypothetical protein FHX15_004841 [Rhizobium sp. BK650]|nr:hypothetical protein [Rhizobium sp. BK650]